MPYTSAALAQLTQGEHTDAVIALEQQTATEVGLAETDSGFEKLIRRALTAWVAAYGSITTVAVAGAALHRITATVRAAVRRLLDDLAPRAHNTLRGTLRDALTLGARQGAAFVHAASGRARNVPTVRVGSDLTATADHITHLLVDRRDRALSLLRSSQVRRWSDLLTGIGAGRSATAAVRAHIAWTINRAVAQGLDVVATAAATGRLWVAEADACVRCLAYTGRIVATGQSFPGGLSWDPRQRTIGAASIDGPPLHAHCRCRAVPWLDRWPADGVPFPLALQREAHRSIAYGTARPSESRAARLRAVRELLRTEPDLLPAVEARARTALRTGRFTQAA
jgi:hypothetical protein